MDKPFKATMLPGYNHNVNYKGLVFHVQTEDSGIKNPHIITLLFVGGNIIARKKVSYADILTHEKLQDVVRELMQDQHKAMLKDLKKGSFDGNPLAQAEFKKKGINVPVKPSAAAQAKPAPVAAVPAPAAQAEAEIQEKPTGRTIELSEDQELRDEDIFGQDIISSKSLDEVILSFLTQRIEDEEK
jgi:hypothetical protein